MNDIASGGACRNRDAPLAAEQRFCGARGLEAVLAGNLAQAAPAC